MKRYSLASNPQRPRPWLLLWLVPFLWSVVGSSIHDPGDCAGEQLCKRHAHGHHHCPGEVASGQGEAAAPAASLVCLPVVNASGDADQHCPDEAAERHDAERHQGEDHHQTEGAKGQPTLGASTLASDDGCLECQWISASALFLAASVDIYLTYRQITPTSSPVYSLLSSSTPSPFSRGPPATLTFAI